MATKVIKDPLGSNDNIIYGSLYGAKSSHDAALAFDTIYYGLGGSDLIYDTDANGWMWAGYGDNSPVTFFGNGGDDVLVGFDGDDIFSGGSGSDVLIGNNGNDTLKSGVSGAAPDQLWGGAGGDYLLGDVGAQWLIGGGGGTSAKPDIMWGGKDDYARDILIGTAGSVDYFLTGTGGTTTTGSQLVDIAWFFTPGEDIIHWHGSSISVSKVADFAGTGLAGTLISQDGTGTWQGDIFLAGVEVSLLSLLTSGSIIYLPMGNAPAEAAPEPVSETATSFNFWDIITT